MKKEFLLIEDRRWNNEDIRIVFIGTENEAFEWVLKNTCHSFSGALNDQGYYLLELKK